MIALIATEGAISLKSAADLAIGNEKPEEDEQDYQKIAGGTLTIAITGAMMLLGELAADLAKAIWNGAKSLFKGAGTDAAADAAAAGAHGAGDAPKADELPEGKATGSGDTAGRNVEVINGETVVASEPTADGHAVKVTEEGTCLTCSNCAETAIEFTEELKADADLKSEFDEIVSEADLALRAKRLAEFREKLLEARAKAAKPTPAEAPDQAPNAASDLPRHRAQLGDVKIMPDPASLTPDPARTGLSLNCVLEDAALDGGRKTVGIIEIELGPDGLPRVTMKLEARANIDGTKHAIDFLDESGERVGLTNHALDQASEASKNAFGEDVHGFDGGLAGKNKVNFVEAWNDARWKLGDEHPDWTVNQLDDAAAAQAIREISFGEAREKIGFSEMEVKLSDFKLEEVGNPPRVRRVPDSDRRQDDAAGRWGALIPMTDEGKPSPIRQEIERTLGRPLSAGELAPVRALPDLPEEVLATAAALPEILKIWYLRRLVDESERRNVPAFVEEVVDGDVPAAHWRRGGILLPDFTVPDLLRRDATDILAVVPTDGGAWRRYPVSREAWREGDTYVGAPAAERPDLDRRFQTPAHVTRVHTPGIVLEREEAPERLARRWIAARVARVARLTDAGAAEDPPTLVRAVLPDAGSLSADATVAVHALLRELSELGRPSDREVPGFRGPDVWYERP